VKGQGHRDNKCIFHINDYYAYVNAHLTTAIRRGFELYDYECLLLFLNCRYQVVKKAINHNIEITRLQLAGVS